MPARRLEISRPEVVAILQALKIDRPWCPVAPVTRRSRSNIRGDDSQRPQVDREQPDRKQGCDRERRMDHTDRQQHDRDRAVLRHDGRQDVRFADEEAGT